MFIAVLFIIVKKWKKLNSPSTDKWINKNVKVKFAQSCPTLYDAMEFSNQNTEVDSLFLWQEIFPTQGLNLGFLHCRWILYQLSQASLGYMYTIEWYMYTLEQQLAIKRNDVLVHATTWIQHKNTMLNERCQTQKSTYCMSSFI